MFSLRSAAARFQHDEFHPWIEADGAFDTSAEAIIVGRLFRIDRFTTIYHRPTRRRQITLPPRTVLPQSLVVKHRLTGEIFILSQSHRMDSVAASVYDDIVTGHLAMPPSGGRGTVFRPTLQGTLDDPGPAELIEIADTYMDVELRTTENVANAEEQTVANTMIVISSSVSVADNDWVRLNGANYKVTEPYFDGGFTYVRALKEPYDLSVLTYYFDTGFGGGYDPETGVVTQTVTEAKQISGIVVLKQETASGTGEVEAWSGKAYIDVNMITWKPTINHSIEYAGVKYKIVSVTLGKAAVQWELGLQQWQGYLASVGS